MPQTIIFNTSQFDFRSKLLGKVLRKKTTEALDAIGAFVESEAKDRAPIDEGSLVSDIEHQVYSSDESVVVRVPINAVSSEYAVRMHEDDYNLGLRSANKQAMLGKVVGKKYITRGIDEEKREIKDIVKKEMQL